MGVEDANLLLQVPCGCVCVCVYLCVWLAGWDGGGAVWRASSLGWACWLFVAVDSGQDWLTWFPGHG